MLCPGGAAPASLSTASRCRTAVCGNVRRAVSVRALQADVGLAAGFQLSQSALKVLHVPFGFYPDSVGGTEVYVEALSRNLQQFGFGSTIAAPGSHDAIYEYQ